MAGNGKGGMGEKGKERGRRMEGHEMRTEERQGKGEEWRKGVVGKKK